MSMFDHDNRWTEDEMRDIAKMWIREGLAGALLSGFAGHPDERLAALVVAELTVPKIEKPKEIRFTPNAARYARWTRSAEVAGIPLTAWIQLVADGWLKISVPDESPTAPVQETTQERKGTVIRPASGWLRERIVAELGDGWFGAKDIPALAKKLGEPPRSVMASIQSMVNSKRAVYDKNARLYRIVKGE